MMDQTMLERALDALATFHAEHVGDFVYTIREREGLGWDGPRVQAWSDAAAACRDVLLAAGRIAK